MSSTLALPRAGQRLLSATAPSISTTTTTTYSARPPWSSMPSLCASPLCRNTLLSAQQTRGYKQVRLPADQGPPIPSPTAQQPEIPPYPLGNRRLYKQANTGLYGNARIRFGNIVSRETEIINPQKNRRKWRPNIQEKRLWSASLGIPIRTRISTRVLRTLDKVGGLDEYLLGSKPARIAELGPWGWRLRWRIMQTPVIQERFRQQRIALGLPEEGLPAEGVVGETEAVDVDKTQKMIDTEEVFDLAPDEFMKEEGRTKKA